MDERSIRESDSLLRKSLRNLHRLADARALDDQIFDVSSVSEARDLLKQVAPQRTFNNLIKLAI